MDFFTSPHCSVSAIKLASYTNTLWRKHPKRGGVTTINRLYSSVCLILLRTAAPKMFPCTDFFFKLAVQKGNDLPKLPKREKYLGVTDFVLERTCPEKYPKSEKSGFVSCYHSVCKPQNAITCKSLK